MIRPYAYRRSAIRHWQSELARLHRKLDHWRNKRYYTHAVARQLGIIRRKLELARYRLNELVFIKKR